ncbi:MAG: IS4 family transposase [Chloroflexi bacterium]|nr:IS4 family transposase [Chloroflexota bacterium]
MQTGTKQFSPDTVAWLRQACADGVLSRRALARGFCEREQWLDHAGRPNLASASPVLARLAERLGMSLPEVRGRMPDAHPRPAADYPDQAVSGSLDGLGTLSLVPVMDRADGRRWESMIETHHRRGWHRAPGGLLRYWIVSETRGVLGGIGFCAGGMQLAPRDRMIGWSSEACMSNIGQVVCNQRFLILPGVRVPKLASRVLGMAAQRVAQDWEERYHVRPVLAYTFTESGQGWCYRAARWRCCPELSSGRRSGVRRAVWIKPLAPGWRSRLCTVPRRALGWSHPLPEGSGDWAEREYARCSYPDGRVRERLVAMGRCWTRRLGRPLPAIFPGAAGQKAAYRLLSNPRIHMQHVLESHLEATVERCREQEVVLAIQDTTTLNYNGLQATGELDSLGGGGRGTRGLLVHAGMAVNGHGHPLGLFLMDGGFRRQEEKDSARWVEGLGRTRELAAACPDSRVVAVCDREGDFWELLRDAQEQGGELLVRASRSARRRVMTAQGVQDLWEHVEGTEPLGTQKIRIPASGGPRARRERRARLTVRATEVDLVPPQSCGGRPIRMLAVSARELSPPGRKPPLDWMLLSTAGSADLGGARMLLDWYRLRWQIERFFHALKQGTRIEDRQLDRADDLRKCVAFDAVTAFRVWDLSWLGRNRPDDPATWHVDRETVEVLLLLAQAYRLKIPRGPPTVAAFVALAGGLAGFHPKKRQPLPGTGKLWQGLLDLNTSVFAIRALREQHSEDWAPDRDDHERIDYDPGEHD